MRSIAAYSESDNTNFLINLVLQFLLKTGWKPSICHKRL